ncbi:uncharacterized protein LACBIDRAFT_317968 [Laccaria bicolor S238N-H82]|uniref:Predicted protein n=1 Tax=Laccaria bicolor (strain S238N-H82 / ATCC MYA-4686) TaxID=486041 RepID=B0D5M6_LACBS|nr:uncharacterized protein LACBIDRAFT_317968 [Laccaria bicolor S238N-H82]EDR10043.1 predicted protein [Laccaria bicolor S238N-H82]|eukprot:XP_001879428.1 predicted protein [Laccaria bicolor S238N-H82]
MLCYHNICRIYSKFIRSNRFWVYSVQHSKLKHYAVVVPFKINGKAGMAKAGE